ncbi:MAG: DegV family EDD domain-containing protein [Clostridia bacterium]|nr:DegV family EDD domain-containing protein [Clostridia bacterium]
MADKFVILADCTCDLSREIRECFDIDDYIQGYVSISDGRDLRTTLDWENIEREEFYKTLSNKKIKVTTAPASPEEYYLAFKNYAEQGTKVLSMSLSSTISSTYDVACVAAQRVKKELPKAEIYCFDSYRMSGGFGLLVMYAQAMKKECKTVEDRIEWLEANKHRVHQMGPIDDLIFVARRGRISMGKAIMGSFAGVKPMGDCDCRGFVSVLAKVKGINRALDITAKYAQKMAIDIGNQYVIISHSDREKYANQLKKLIEDTLSPKKVFVSDVFSGSGANVGPGMVGIYFLGEEISEDLVAEKAVMNELLEKVK